MIKKTWISFVLVGLIVVLVGCPQPTSNKAWSITSLTADIASGTVVVPVEVRFTAEVSHPNGDDFSYSWDVSIREETEAQTIDLAELVDETSNVLTYRFDSAGTYDITVTASDGKRDVSGTIDYVVGANGAPEISAMTTSLSQGRVPLSVDFSVEALDPEGDALFYLWDFGDEVSTQTLAEGREVSFIFEQVGLYTVSVAVSDGFNDAVIETVMIDAQENQAPSSVSLTADPVSGVIPLNVSFQAAADDSNGDELSFSWDFGDGREDDCSPSASCSHSFRRVGTFDVVVTASDGLLSTASDPLQITIEPSDTNIAPIINAFEVDQSEAAIPFTATFRVDAIDPDGDQLVYSWDFGDGTTIVSSDSPTQSHEYRTEGDFAAVVSVSDGQFEESATVSIVGLANTAPVIDAFTVSDNAGRVPTTITFEVEARDADGHNLQYFYDFGVAGQPEVEAGERTSFTYTTVGSFDASVRVFDGLSSVSASQTIEIRSNSQPVIDSLTASTMEGPLPLTVDFSVTASDQDGDNLAVSWDFGDGNSAQGLDVSHTYSEIDDYVVTVTVNDGQVENNKATAELEVFVTSATGNRRPQISSTRRNLVSTATRGKVPATYQFNADIKDGNSDGSTISYTLDFGDGTSETVNSADVLQSFQGGEDFMEMIEASHTYEAVGNFTPRLTVSDGELDKTTSFAPVSVLAATYAGTYRWTAVNHPSLCSECQPFAFAGIMNIDREISQDDVDLEGFELTIGQASAGTGNCTEGCNFSGVTFVGEVTVLDTDTLGIMVSDAIDLEVGNASNIKLIAGQISGNFLGLWEPIFNPDGSVTSDKIASVTFERIGD